MNNYENTIEQKQEIQEKKEKKENIIPFYISIYNLTKEQQIMVKEIKNKMEPILNKFNNEKLKEWCDEDQICRYLRAKQVIFLKNKYFIFNYY